MSKDVFSINEAEVMEYYGLHGNLGKLSLRAKLLRSWFLHSLSYSSPHPGFAIQMQRSRGVKIGDSCYIAPYILLDLLYPQLIEIENNVSIGSNTMIFAHSNPTASLFLKENHYPRKVNPVKIKSGVWINPGCIIGPGVTIGKNSVLSVGTIVTKSVPDNCVVAGNHGKIVKKLNE